MRTAFELDQLVILLDHRRNPAEDPELRAKLIASCNARNFSWAHADEQGIHHQVTGDSLHPVVRSGLITWQQLWDVIGPSITQERVDELHAAIRDGAAKRARCGPHTDMRLYFAIGAFFRSRPDPVQLDLFDALAGAR